MRHALPLFTLAAALLGSGCGPDCQSSCERLYGDGAPPDECGLSLPTHSSSFGRQSIIDDCTLHCERAMDRNGKAGEYDPNGTSNNSDVYLENEIQAAMWMDCVNEASCEKLEEGMCAPTQNFQ